MNSTCPQVSIGLPVYNGKNYVREAIESILAQTYADFELIISDNCSQDATAHICAEYAAQDPRVTLYHQSTNTGAAPNFNFVFHKARGEYFKWAAHDDVLAPDFLKKCVEVLDRDPGVVLCCPKIIRIDDQGQPIHEMDVAASGECDNPVERFSKQMNTKNSCEHVFGLIRQRQLQTTELIGSYQASDRVLLSELAIHGKFHQLHEPLFYHRDHSNRFIYSYLSEFAQASWFNPNATKECLLPNWTVFLKYLAAIHRTRTSWRVQRQCVRFVFETMWKSTPVLKKDLIFAMRRLYRVWIKGQSMNEVVADFERETKSWWKLPVHLRKSESSVSA